MSQTPANPPQPTPESGQPPVPPIMEYQSALRPRTCKLAIDSMLLGIFSIPAIVVLVGPLFGIVALIMGIIALRRANRLEAGGKGFAIVGIVTGVVSTVGGPILFLIPSVGSGTIPSRSACGANLTGIVKSMILYSADNSDEFPIVLPPPAPGRWTASGAGANGSPDKALDNSDAIKIIYGSGGASTGKTQAGDPMANLWLLVINGSLSPKQFICPSDPAVPTPALLRSIHGTDTNFDTAAIHYSYAFAYMWDNKGNVGGWWKNTVDSSLPLGTDAPSAFLPGVSNPDATGADYKQANSKNHSGGEGQEVVFADAHVEFDKNPNVGQGGDNIFKIGTGAACATNTATKNSSGAAPGAGASGAYDIIMVPARNPTGTAW